MLTFSKNLYLEIWRTIGRRRSRLGHLQRPLRILLLSDLVEPAHLPDLIGCLQVFAPGSVHGLVAGDLGEVPLDRLWRRDTHCVTSYHGTADTPDKYLRLLRRSDVALILTDDIEQVPHVLSLFAAKLPAIFGWSSIGARMLENERTGLAMRTEHPECFIELLKRVSHDTRQLDAIQVQLEEVASRSNDAKETAR